jgi:hypothetical protein
VNLEPSTQPPQTSRFFAASNLHVSKEDNLDFSNIWDFVFQYRAVILWILGLTLVLIKLLNPRKAPAFSVHLTGTEIGQAEAAGRQARNDVKRRFGNHFGDGKP